MRKRGGDGTGCASVPAPRGLRAERIVWRGAEHVVLSFPLVDIEFPSELTAAERAIAALLLAGESNAGIAGSRRSAMRTVANQVASIFRKLGVRSRAELAARFGART